MKPGIPKGTRDFSSQEIYKRQYVQQIIRKRFENFGFEPLETPSFELLETLTGKYGEEGDRLIFKILNSGDYLTKANDEYLQNKNSLKLTKEISEKALRYDLTVPFARYVAMNHTQLPMPFRRYQIQPVWRADRPQKGRYREFYQCDADIVGSTSILLDIELCALYGQVFSDLNLPIHIHLNNRKVLQEIASILGVSDDKFLVFSVILDKIDKIGIQEVLLQWKDMGIEEEKLHLAQNLFGTEKNSDEMILFLNQIFELNTSALHSLEELKKVYEGAKNLLPSSSEIRIDLSLARGLDYYTGSIFEVKSPSVAMGSLGGGGRYDDLTGMFGLKNMPGIGISFGLDRIILVMEELSIFQKLGIGQNSGGILFANLGQEESIQAMMQMMNFRNKNPKSRSELYPESAKIKKQFSFAEKKGYEMVAIIGSEEIEKQEIQLKNIVSGEQTRIPFDSL